MRFVVPLVIVGALTLIPLTFGGSPLLRFSFSVVFPYFAALLFLVGFIFRVLKWARSPVPFRIPTTAGQEKSLAWIRHSRLDNPHNGWQAAWRVLTEALFFRSLFRNTKAELHAGPVLAYGSSKWLWLGGLAFHYSLLVVLLRHFRFFTEPPAGFVQWIQSLDGFFQVGVPVIYASDAILVAALGFLLLRRLVDAKLRYFSLAADYFPLALILAIAGTGLWMRHLSKVDLTLVKEMAMGLATLAPISPEGAPRLFIAHLFLVSVLFAYFPFSKLMHLGGIFLSPTRNLANNNRALRHENPWNAPVPVHTYEEYEDEFRDLMKAADLPVDKE